MLPTLLRLALPFIPPLPPLTPATATPLPVIDCASDAVECDDASAAVRVEEPGGAGAVEATATAAPSAMI